MGDVYYPPQAAFPFSSSYPAQLSQPNPAHRGAPPNAYLAALHSQLRETGQVNSDLVKQHETALMPNLGQGEAQRTGMGSAEAWRQSQIIRAQLHLQQQQQHAGQPYRHEGGRMDVREHSPAVVDVLSPGDHLHNNRDGSDRNHDLLNASGSGAGSKRGRKAKEEEDHSPEFAEATLDEVDGDDEELNRKRGRGATGLSANEKRKLQNRAAQRAFRERKEKHVRDLEEKVAAQDDQLHLFRDMIEGLLAENDALRRGEPVQPASSFRLPSPPKRNSVGSGSQPPSPSFPPPSHSEPHPFLAPRGHSFDHGSGGSPFVGETDTGSSDAPIPTNVTLARTPVIMERGGGETPETVDGFRNYGSPAGTGREGQHAGSGNTPRQTPYPQQSYLPPQQTSGANEKVLDDNVSFDFDAPFDFTDSVSLPPLFQDSFDQSFPNATSGSTASPSTGLTPSARPPPSPLDPIASSSTLPPSRPSLADSPEPDPISASNSRCPEEDEPAFSDPDDTLPLPNGRLPCNKPECDFSVVSCALPIPWRPQSIGEQVRTSDIWACKQAWAKLCSHPLFDQCDVDELCHELRDRTRCSNDGKLVIAKSDVCEVFGTIPARAKLRQQSIK